MTIEKELDKFELVSYKKGAVDFSKFVVDITNEALQGMGSQSVSHEGFNRILQKSIKVFLDDVSKDNASR